MPTNTGLSHLHLKQKKRSDSVWSSSFSLLCAISMSSVSLWLTISQQNEPQRHRGHGDFTETKLSADFRAKLAELKKLLRDIYHVCRMTFVIAIAF